MNLVTKSRLNLEKWRYKENSMLRFTVAFHS